MFGLPDQALGHLTSSGTIANLESLWVARELAGAQRSCTQKLRITPMGGCVRFSASSRGRSRRILTAASISMLSRPRLLAAFAALHPDIARDRNSVRVLRSVLMKPEHEAWIEPLHARLEMLARSV